VASTGAFPVTVEHAHGTTVIEEEPERVVSVGFNDQDPILALGVVPVGIRDWYGDQPDATWPWAHDLLGGARPTVLPSDAVDVEAVAALRPDLIVGVSAGLTDEEYELLSAIAPTIVQPPGVPDYQGTWQDQMRVIGRALRRGQRADELVAEVEGRLADVRADHPELAGLEATMSFALDETQIGAYPTVDARGQLLVDLGMVVPPEIDELAGGQFYTAFSYEEIDRLDRDVLVWITSDPAVVDQIQAHPLRRQLRAFAEGREVFLTQLEAGAASFSSVLSLPHLLDTLVPKLLAAADGDPSTPVPA
jgi:iron complex transport system substrate-binding protein